GGEAWSIITEVAAAEFGSVFWDENGFVQFWNLTTVLGKQSNAVKTVSLDDVSGLEFTNSSDSVRNCLAVQTTDIRGVEGLAWSADDPDMFELPTNQTQVTESAWPTDVIGIDIDPRLRTATANWSRSDYGSQAEK